mmetsp:Transcript_18998/g.38404  ORF Transcript_18998/g.38404 Transcript_18998/m.38404 type:complete len:88 (-) Transcript_18998:2124-2387(-)
MRLLSPHRLHTLSLRPFARPKPHTTPPAEKHNAPGTGTQPKQPKPKNITDKKETDKNRSRQKKESKTSGRIASSAWTTNVDDLIDWV